MRRINEARLNNIVRRTVKRVLREGTTDDSALEKWDWLVEMVGAEHMLSCLLTWASSDQIDQWIEWFDEEGYLEGYEGDNEDEEEYNW